MGLGDGVSFYFVGFRVVIVIFCGYVVFGVRKFWSSSRASLEVGNVFMWEESHGERFWVVVRLVNLSSRRRIAA